MQLPVLGPITQGFGGNYEWYARFGLKGHNGLDIGVAYQPCYAPVSGRVVEVAYDKTGYGYYIKIENNEEGALVGHLSKQEVKVGQLVFEGAYIGETGNSGNSTGPHCHFGYYRVPRDKNNGYAGYIDPNPYLNVQPKEVDMTRKETLRLLSESFYPGRTETEHVNWVNDKDGSGVGLLTLIKDEMLPGKYDDAQLPLINQISTLVWEKGQLDAEVNKLNADLIACNNAKTQIETRTIGTDQQEKPTDPQPQVPEGPGSGQEVVADNRDHQLYPATAGFLNSLVSWLRNFFQKGGN